MFASYVLTITTVATRFIAMKGVTELKCMTYATWMISWIMSSTAFHPVTLTEGGGVRRREGGG